MNDLAPIPLDDAALNAIDDALTALWGWSDEEGGPVLVRGEYTLSQLLDFWAGFDPNDSVLISEVGDPLPVYVCNQPTYHEHDLIKALVAEVRRLRVTT